MLVIKDKHGKVITWSKDNKAQTVISGEYDKELDVIYYWGEDLNDINNYYITRAFSNESLYPITEFDIKVNGNEITLLDYEIYNPLK